MWLSRTKKAFSLVAIHAALLGVSAVMLAPLVWLLAAALKSPEDLWHYTFFSPNPTLHNFRTLFEQTPLFGRFMLNSLFISSAITLVQLFFSSLAGFALAKYEFRGQKIVFVFMLCTMMIPYQILLAPMYQLLTRMGLVDSYWALLLPASVSVYGTILFRQAMLDVPEDLLDAGRIDGCSEFRLYWLVVLPVCRPMVGAFCLVAYLRAWNNFLWPQIVLQSKELFTLPIALNQMVGLYSQEYGSLMAGTMLSILPVMILFFLLQREFVSGLTAGAVKG